MKKIIILMVGLIMIGIHSGAKAGDLIVEGKVGIGTNTPAEKQHNYVTGSQGEFGGWQGKIGLLIEGNQQHSPALALKSTYGAGYGIGRIVYDADNFRFNFWGEWGGQPYPVSFGVPAGGVILWGGVSAPGYITRDAEGIKLITPGGGVNGIYLQTKSDNTQKVMIPYGNVGIGTTNPAEKLEIVGKVKAQEFITGDITFQKDGETLWRMFEDEDGLYLESAKTGKVYKFVLQEVERE